MDNTDMVVPLRLHRQLNSDLLPNYCRSDWSKDQLAAKDQNWADFVNTTIMIARSSVNLANAALYTQDQI